MHYLYQLCARHRVRHWDYALRGVPSWLGRQSGLRHGEQAERSVLGDRGGHERKCSRSPREVREGFAEAVTFELSLEEEQVL